jgi:hypothetical protein
MEQIVTKNDYNKVGSQEHNASLADDRSIV